MPLENLKKFNIKLIEQNFIQINTLITLLENYNHLTNNQWKNACDSLDIIIRKFSQNIEETCSAALISQLTNRTAQQGGFLPRKLAKPWKKHLATYHLIIYITKNNPNWQTHPILNEIHNYQHVQFPTHPQQTPH